MSEQILFDPEEALLGAILIDGEQILKVVDFLKADDFLNPIHQKIYQAMLDLFEKRMAIDIITISNRLREMGQLEVIGGRSYLLRLIQNVPSVLNISSYARLIKTQKAKDELLKLSKKIKDILQENKEAEDLIDEVESEVFKIAHRVYPHEFQPLGGLLDEAYERIQDLQKGVIIRGVPTGIPDLDQYLGGLQKSDLIILASRPSQGKTAFALSIARYLAVNQGIPVGIFSLEMSKDQIVDRLIAMESGVSLWRIRTGKVISEGDIDELALIYEACERLKKAPIFIDDTPSLNNLQIRAMSRKLKHEIGELGLLIIDYLQLLRTHRQFESRVQEVTEISKSLKELARELDIPVLAVSQLSRAPEQRVSQIPRLADLRESGSLEQDSDVVIFLHRAREGNTNLPATNQIDVIVAKNRNGPVGGVKAYFDPDTVSFYPIDTSLQEIELH
jgi:replicative DNA helicase